MEREPNPRSCPHFGDRVCHEAVIDAAWCVDEHHETLELGSMRLHLSTSDAQTDDQKRGTFHVRLAPKDNDKATIAQTQIEWMPLDNARAAAVAWARDALHIG